MAAVAGAGFAGLAFFEKYLLGYGLGTAAGPALRPYVQTLANLAWTTNAVRPLDPHDLAQLIAKQIPSTFDEHYMASQTGIDSGPFDQLVQLARQYPGFGEAIELLRRDPALLDSVKGWLNRHGYSDAVTTELLKLQHARLTPSDMANAVQQGFVDNAGLLPADVTGPPFAVPSEQTTVPTLAEFADFGIDPERAKLLAFLSGLPPGPVEMSQMVMRKQISSDTFFHGIREGHTKTKWGSALLYYLTHPLLTPAVEIRRLLKGWQDKTTTDTRLAQYGYTPAQVQDWYEAEGRPAAPGQMATAIARGIDGPDGRPMDEPQFLKGIRESDIRPEWGPMLYGIRFAYPPLFQINRLVQAKAISAAVAVEWAKKDRYAPEVIVALDAYWSGGSTVAADPHITKAQTQLWSTAHSSYLASESTDAEAESAMTAAGVLPTATGDVLALWQHERSLIRKQLTPAQIKKAYAKLSRNFATGAAWTRDDALAALVARGYSVTEANDFLDIP